MISSTLASSDYVWRTVLPWETILDDLKAAGVSRKMVADMIGIPWTTVQRWHKNGVEPRESAARAILTLHARHCGQNTTQQRSLEARPLL